MNSTGSFQGLETESTVTTSWIDSDWMKEWKVLAARTNGGRNVGYWYYDNTEKIYKYEL